ncbi:MAG TPA: Asp-tRNA(Asn)/Glu-tRNA(Gln) amidotransferase subunit GatC [Planctomycetota bacterium]|nr:Asp-tRNA(Asn)/Glu-tRNA(Gln) amidotransferase subunit GatC [Planctomycetota bacterium]
MAITPEDVTKVAKLSRLALSAEETQMYTEQLGKILHYVEKLNAVDTSKVEPMITAAASGNVFRKDEVRPCLKREEALAAAPEQDDEFFRVPPVIE